MDFKINTIKDFLITVMKLKDANTTEIANNCKIHYTWTISVVKYCKKKGFIVASKRKMKRENRYKITDKGKQLIKILR